MRNQVVKILVFFGCVLALCAYAALAQQAGQQKPPRVARLGVPAEKVEPPQVPLGMQVFPAINSWGLDALAFSLDGEWLASGGYGDTVMVWNAATGAEQSRLSRPQTPNNAVVKLAFSPDGTHLAELRYNGRVTIWDFQKATVVSSTKLRSGAGIPFVYSPDGKTWATSGTTPKGSTVSIEIHDASSGRILRAIPTKWYRIIGIVMTTDGILAASGLTVAGIADEQDPQGTVEEWQLAIGKPVKSSPVFSVVGLVSRDGKWMASLGPEDTQVLTLSAVLSPDGKRVAIERSWGLIDLLDLESGTALGSLGTAIAPSNYGPMFGKGNLAFSADGTTLFEGASCPPNDFKSAYKLSPVSESSTTPSEKSTHGPAPCSPDCKLVAG